MNILIIILVFIGCLAVGGKSTSASCFALFLCGCCFFFGTATLGDILQEKAKNRELIELGGKYYAIKYIKDKVE